MSLLLPEKMEDDDLVGAERKLLLELLTIGVDHRLLLVTLGLLQSLLL